MLPNLSTLAVSPGNVLVRCPECATLFRKASPTAAGCGCPECELGKRKRDEEEKEKECGCKKECACDDVDVPDPNDPNTSEQWKNAFWKANGYSTGRTDAPEEWMVEAARRKIAEEEWDKPPPIVVPEPGDPNMDAQWKNAYLKARGISYGSLSAGNEGEDNPEPWQIEAARRKLAPQDRGPPQPEEEEEEKEESEDESEGEGDDVGDWEDDANFDYYRAVMPIEPIR